MVIMSIGVLVALAVLIIGAPSIPQRTPVVKSKEDIYSPELYWD